MAAAPLYLHHPSSLDHETGLHPERGARIVAIEEELERQDWLGFERVRSAPIELETLTAVHPGAYVDTIHRFVARGGGHLDLDTIVSSGSFDAALHSAGGAVQLVDALLDGRAPCGFSAHRPPGHHAETARAMGFCLFNNIAIAARHAIDARGLQRVMIFDWDVHHGNGTADIFKQSSDVLLVSIHQHPLYPGTGAATDVGSGPGRGFTVNVPVPAGTDDSDYQSLVEHVVAPLALSFEPQLMLISAGYDAHREDQLAGCDATEAGFAAMTRIIRRVCATLEIPVGCVLEGGYALEALARSVAATMEALVAPVVAVAAGSGSGPGSGSGSGSGSGVDEVRVSPLASQALGRLREWWPALAS
jgi:acetoin utilization deacetylase AcuC-like enzyme